MVYLINTAMSLEKFRKIVILAESVRPVLEQQPLAFKKTDLAPVVSKDTLDYHYGKLAKGYVDRYNKKEGDDDFNYGGAILHNLFFSQLMIPKSSNVPSGEIKEIIENKWRSFDKFKDEFAIEFMKAKGSNWLYLDSKGNIKVIHNHEYGKNMDIVLLFDGWEHAWALDYEHDKKKYLDNFWRIVDWEIINDRIQGE